MDLGVVLSLAAVFWLHGWRRDAEAALLVVHTPLAGWWVREPFARVGPLILATWWPALTITLVVHPGDAPQGAPWQHDFEIGVARARRRLSRVSALVIALRVMGAAFMLWIVLGVPLAVSRFGIAGLVGGLLAALPVLLLIGLCTWGSLRLLRSVPRQAFRSVLSHVGPFSAPFAAECVIEEALRGVATPACVASLLGEQRFLKWIRPWAYDARHTTLRDEADPGDAMARLLKSLPDEVAARSIRALPPESGESGSPYCPRCGSSYLPTVTVCSACGSVELTSAVAIADTGALWQLG